MKKTILLPFIVIGFIFATCSNNERNRQIEQEKDELKIKMKNTIDQIDTKIQSLLKELETTEIEERDYFNERIEELRESKSELQNRLDNFDSSVKSNWEEFKNEVNKSLEIIRSRIEDVKLNIDTTV